MREGWYIGDTGQRVTQCMQFQQGDILPCDIIVPAGLDPDAAATGAARRPQILAEQLFDRQVVTEYSGLSFSGIIISEEREPAEDGR